VLLDIWSSGDLEIISCWRSGDYFLLEIISCWRLFPAGDLKV
jgi:hypothetical protein